MNSLIILFFSSFIAATLFPAGSEIILTNLALQKNLNPILLVLIATLGNVLGSVINYILGRYLMHFENKKWFLFKKSQIQKATNHFQKYGKFSLLFAWLPIIGDPLTLIAGFFKTNIWIFLTLVTIGKMGRYVLLVGIFS